MATKDRGNKSDIQKFKAPEGLPDYLAEVSKNDESLDTLKQERTLSRLKIISGNSGADLKKLFDEGDVIANPGQTLIAKAVKADQASEPFFMVPLFFFIEFCHWSDVNDNASPTIFARSFDKGSDLAAKARNADAREENYGDGYVSRYVEHLNFASVIVGDHPLAGQMEPFVIGFQRSSWATGKNLITTLARLEAPLWSTVWGFQSKYITKKFNYWNFDYFVPDEEKHGIGRFITKDQVDLFKATHLELKELFEERMLVVDRSDSEDIDEGDSEF